VKRPRGQRILNGASGARVGGRSQAFNTAAFESGI
jgi:hypothetical protein